MPDESHVCFVVMPYGIKSLLDGSGRQYDFDKVYRVIIRRAIRDAGMKPYRADEEVGSGLIHTDMFRDLRDRPVVLADLSLENPNVFYELGIRHVMADSGTVLICREGATLPFDVGLSRVIFYKYDGASLDWEEVERVTPIVLAALQEARRGKPDSPVHALLPGTVLRAAATAQKNQRVSAGAAESDELEKYERMLASNWLTAGMDLDELYEEHRGTIFGTRALGILCLEIEKVPVIASTIAARLTDQEQNRLANRLFERLLKSDMAGWQDILRYATSYSEAKPNLSAANRAIDYAQQALDAVKAEFSMTQLQTDVEALFAYGECMWRISSLRRWRYQLTDDTRDLEDAIKTCQESLDYLRSARVLGGLPGPGRLAQANLVIVLLLRIRDNDRMTPNHQKYLQAVLDIKEMTEDNPIEVSWLHWYQAVALADTGDKDAATQLAQRTIAEDARLRTNPEYWEVGRRQYVLLRRFIEQYSPYFRHPAIVGVVSQIIQYSSDTNR